MLYPDLPDDGDIRFLKVRDVGGVLNATIEFIRRTAKSLLLSFLAIVGPLALVSGIASVLMSRQMVGWMDLMAMSSDPESFAVNGLGSIAGFALLAVVVSLLTLAVAWAAVGGFVRVYRSGVAAPAVGEVWDEARGLVLPMLGGWTLVLLAMTGSAFLNVIPCLGTLAWLALVIWASPVLSVAFASRAVEAGSFGEAWRRARTLVKGSWGPAFGAMFIAGLAYYAVAIAVSYPAMAAQFAESMNSLEDGTVPMVTANPLYALLQVLTVTAYVIPLVTAFFVHGRLAEEMDGGGLQDEIDALGDLALAPDARSEWADASEAGPTDAAPAQADAPGSTTAPPPADPSAPSRSGGGFRGGGFDAS